MDSSFHRVDVYDSKVSLRTKLHLLKTIAKKLAEKEERYNKFKSSVFGPWLDIRTEDHDNLVLNFLLQHQRDIKDATTDMPFIFDIGHNTLEFGRRQFCLLTGFKFGNPSLDHLSESVSNFHNRVFPTLPRIKGEDLKALLETDKDFKKLSHDDSVRVFLLLALEYVFMGNELRHVIPYEILALVDDLSAFDAFPWGQYIWEELHLRVYNVDSRHRKDILKKIATHGKKYKPQYSLNGFVFVFKIWLLEHFPNATNWWHKDDDVVPRCVSWSNGITFTKADCERLLYSRESINTLVPTEKEINTSWWTCSLDYFKNGSTEDASHRPLKKRKVIPRTHVQTEVHTEVHCEVHREVHVRTEVHSYEGLDDPALAKKVEDIERAFGSRLSALEKVVKPPKDASFMQMSSVSDNPTEVDQDSKSSSRLSEPSEPRGELIKKIDYIESFFGRRLAALEQHVKIGTNKTVEPCSVHDHEPNVVNTAKQEKPSVNETLERSVNETFEPTSVKVENRFNDSVEATSGKVEISFNDNVEPTANEEKPSLEPDNANEEKPTNAFDYDVQHDPKEMEYYNGGINEAEPELLDSEYKNMFDTPFDNQVVEEQEEEGALKNTGNPLQEQDLMAVETLMQIYVFSPPEKEKDNDLQSPSMKDRDSVPSNDDVEKLATKHPDSVPSNDDQDKSAMNDPDCTPSNDDNEKLVDIYCYGDGQASIKKIPVNFARETRASRYLQDPYMNQPSTTPQKPKVRARKKKCVKRFQPLVSHGGEVIPPWNEDLTRPTGSRQLRVIVPKEIIDFLNEKEDRRFYFPWGGDGIYAYHDFWERLCGIRKYRNGWLSDTHLDLWIMFLWHFRPADADWAMAGPFFSSMILTNRMPGFYADGVAYGLPWFAQSVEKVYFPINEDNVHWVLGELHLRSGVITIYDSLSWPLVENREWWINMRRCFEYKIPKFLQQTEVMEKKGIDPKHYSITFRYADNVPRQGPLYGDCGIWVMINLYRLSNNLPLAVSNTTLAALAYRERLLEFFWKYKIELPLAQID